MSQYSCATLSADVARVSLTESIALAGMNACVEAGRVAEAQEVLNAMRRAQYEPTVRCYNILLKGHAQLRNTDHMCQVMADIRAAGLNPNRVTFNTLLNGFIQTEQLDQVRIALRSLT